MLIKLHELALDIGNESFRHFVVETAHAHVFLGRDELPASFFQVVFVLLPEGLEVLLLLDRHVLVIVDGLAADLHGAVHHDGCCE